MSRTKAIEWAKWLAAIAAVSLLCFTAAAWAWDRIEDRITGELATHAEAPGHAYTVQTIRDLSVDVAKIKVDVAWMRGWLEGPQ